MGAVAGHIVGGHVGHEGTALDRPAAKVRMLEVEAGVEHSDLDPLAAARGSADARRLEFQVNSGVSWKAAPGISASMPGSAPRLARWSYSAFTASR